MDNQERDALNTFLQQLTQAPAPQKEPEADAMIAKALSNQPNAGYLLVQRAMQLDYVLQQSQAKVAELQAELERAKAGTKTSFLAGAHAWGRAPEATGLNPSPAVAPAGRAAPFMQAAASPAAPAMAPAAASSGPSMLGTVATTAAGVVAGSFLFQGIQNLMGNHSPGGGFGNNAANNQTPSTPPGDTIVNNYYTNEPAADQGYSGAGTSYADASDSFSSDDFSSDDSDYA